MKSSPCSLQLGEIWVQQQKPSAAKNKQIKVYEKEKRSPHLILYLILKRILEWAYIYLYI